MKKYTYILSVIIALSGFCSVTPALAVKHVVMVGNFFFNPVNVNVNVGDTIRWVWSAGNHTTTSNPGGIPAGAAPWDELITSSNSSYEYKVTVAGSYSYVCTPHAPGMAGTFTAAGFTPTLSVAPSNRNVTSSAGVTTFSVTSNSSWTAGSDASWCVVTSGGTGNGTLNANYSVNTSVNQRVASITVMVSGLPDQIVTVTQAGAAPTLTVGPANQNVPASSGNTTYDVTSNTTWTVSSNSAWCTVSPSGSGNATITANFSANATNQIRIATITVTVVGLTPQTVTVTQAASTVGMNENIITDLQVYPNPTKGIFKVKAGSIKDQVLEISVLDMSGKKILTRDCSGSDDYMFDISREPKGIYFIRVSSENTTLVKRIVLID